LLQARAEIRVDGSGHEGMSFAVSGSAMASIVYLVAEAENSVRVLSRACLTRRAFHAVIHRHPDVGGSSWR